MKRHPNPVLAQISATHNGSPWYGTSRMTFLKGVTAKAAAAQPIPNSPSVWELLLHMTAWTREVTHRLEGGKPGSPADGNWPSVAAVTPTAWKRAQQELTAAHEALVLTATAIPSERWKERLGTGATIGETLVGIAQHDAFHIGQMALTLRALKGKGG